jgi:hypothetical protein
MLRNIQISPPNAVKWLGYGGLLPFLALMLAALMDHNHARYWAENQAAYGSIILSFVAALHWGFAMTLQGLSDKQRDRVYLWSVCPPLAGWIALMLLPLFSMLLLISSFLAHLWFDRRLTQLTEALPAWYLPLRVRLTAVACISLLVCTFAAYPPIST